MHTATVLTILVALAASAHGQSGSDADYHPGNSIRQYFLGTWKLVSSENAYPDGRKVPYPDLGPNAIGFLMYTPDGHMCAQLMKAGRQRWADDVQPSASESVTALDGFASYCGTFQVRESDRTMIHRPQTAWSPNFVGSEQLRPYHLVSQDRFFFRGTEMEKQKDGSEVQITRTITWERLK